MGDPLTIALLAGVGLMVLSACEFEREGEQVLEQEFIGAQTTLFAYDLVEVNVTVLRPRPGALLAYADCVATAFGKSRGQLFARRIKSARLPTGMADAVGQKVMYLITPVRPEGRFVLTSDEVLEKCKSNGIPTG